MGIHTKDAGKGEKVLMQAVCMLMVCLSLVFGMTPDAHAGKPNSAPLAPPAALAASAAQQRVDLSWSYSDVSGISGFDVERSNSAASGFAQVGTTANATLSYSDQGLADGKTYYYRARAYQQKGKNVDYSAYSSVVSVSTPTAVLPPPPTPTPVAPSAPVLGSVAVNGSDFVLSWSQPDSSYGAPDGGYDIFIDGVDQNNHIPALSATISGLATGTHSFQVEARFTEVSQFLRSDVQSATLQEVAPPPTPTPVAPSAPVLGSVAVNGSDFVLSWSQPDSSYGAPDGGYDLFINGVDQNNHTTALTETLSGLAPGAYTFQVEARFTEVSQFLRSNEVSAALLEVAPSPTPTPVAPSAPVLNSVQVNGSDFVLSWSQPDSSYGAPDGGYDIFVDGVDQNNHTSALSKTISGLAAGTHSFQVEARFTEVSQFLRSNMQSATLEGSVSPAPAPDPTPAPAPDPTPAPAPDPSLGYLPVFPGAQGFGTETKAGRGGQIIKVTNLNDSGSGSLRAAVTASGPRIVVFEVSGTIKLASPLDIKNPFLTVAGQTAPSPGITLRGATVVVLAHDVLLQHLRVRVGDDPDGQAPGDRDGLRISGYNTDTYNVVLDHLSVSWSIDEMGSTPYAPHDITISNTILSESLNNSLHPQGAHSKGFLVREGTQNLALVGNLFAHNHDRNPRITGDSKVVAVNNLLYNGGRPLWFDVELGTHGAVGPHQLSVVGNVFLPGPDTPNYAWPIKVDADCASGTKVYQSDNVATGNILTYGTSFDPRASSPPVWHPSLKPIPGKNVESTVLANVGARPADRDAVDNRIENEVKNRGGSIIDSTGQVGGWPNLAKNTRTFNVPSNPNGDDDGDGYTNVEEVLQQMAAQVEGRASN